MVLRRLDLEAFTDEDFEIIQHNKTPPGRLFQDVALLAYRLGLSSPDDSIAVAYRRAENNACKLMKRQDLPDHVRKYLEKYGLVR